MKNLSFRKKPDGEVEISSMGLTLKINPVTLVKEGMNSNSQRILDSLIEKAYRNSIREFDAWKNEAIKNHSDADDFKEKYEHKIHVNAIQDLADITRKLLTLHSDHEMIMLTDEEKELIEDAFSYWKYNSFYGFESSGSKELEISK